MTMPPAHACSTRVRHGLLRRIAVCLMALALLFPDVSVFAASEHHGQVTFGGLPVPGATVTATQGDKRLVAITDQQGVYTFADLPDGAWTIKVEMLGFATQSQDMVIASDSPSPMWELKLLAFAEIARGIPPSNTAAAPAAGAPAPVSPSGTTQPSATPAPKPTGFQAANVNAATGAPAPAARPAAPAPAADANTPTGTAGDATTAGDLSQRAADGLLVNGSVNNGAASPFAQQAAFGNNRRGPGSLYNGGVGAIFDTSAWDANQFSFSGLPTPKPSYNNVQLLGTLGGPIGIGRHIISGTNFFIAFQRNMNDNAASQSALVPTALQRGGDFSKTFNALGQPVQIINPTTGSPFAGNVIPANQISPQAQALLALYPLPNVAGTFNYQAPTLNVTHQDSLQSRFTKNIDNKNVVFGNLAFQKTATEATNLFGFQDSTSLFGINTQVNWQHRFSRFFSVHFDYTFSRQTTDVTPYFANRVNISGQAGILGNNQTQTNWGPPNLSFATIQPLSDGEYARNANQTNALGYDSTWYHGRHTVAFGGDFRRLQFNILSQQDPRGTFGFTGAATQSLVGGLPVAGTGSDLADFLLGIPDTSSIAFGNADKYLRGSSYDAFINDDWRFSSGLTLNIGLRWEYAAPFTELHNRLVNLDIAPGFTAASPVVAGNPAGPVTGQQYPNSLLRPDHRGVEPRLGFAWRPLPGSPLVVRGGYGVYDITSVYSMIATQLAQQSPLSKTLSIQNSAANPLTLANGFNAAPTVTPNTFAVNPNFRVGYSQNWQVSVQEDLPGSMTMTATYHGIKGTGLMQEFLPNTYPIGATNPCPTCPAGFVYLTSNGNSTHEDGQIQLRRRLRNGITATLQYTYSKSIDDASAFSAANLVTLNGATNGAAVISGSGGSGSIAQNWLDLGADRGPSSFDQRHLLTLQTQYTSGEGLGGGALLGGWRGTLLKEWTFVSQLTVGSGLPLTPIYPVAVPGTGVIGSIRANYTGASVSVAPAGFFLNPAAYTAPAPGQWGNAGRNSITGPGQLSLSASIGRTFRLNNRLNADWTMGATNVLNHVTYTTWNTTTNSPQFGLPNQANTMRRIQTTVRVRF